MREIHQDEFEALVQFLYMVPIGLVQTSLDGEITMINPLSAQLLMPLSRDGSLNNLFTVLEPVAPDLRQRVQAFTGHGMVCEGLQLQVDAGAQGKAAQVLSLSVLKLDATRLMAVLGDISAAVERERKLRLDQAWIDTIVAGITDYALLTLDSAGRATNWNPGVGRLTGHAADAILGESFAIFYPEASMPAQKQTERLKEADSSGWSLDEGWRQRADGSRFWGSCLIAPLHPTEAVLPTTREYSLIIRDISEHREARETLRSALSSDYLTGLANRRAFFEMAEEEVQRWRFDSGQLSLVMIDADHFKRVNDLHGHAVGDAVLRHLAMGLNATFRNTDLIARIGGEEFVILMPGATMEQAVGIANRLVQSIAAQVVEFGDTRIRYTVSAGVATMNDSVTGLADLLKRADDAMYAAKAHGRNCVKAWNLVRGERALRNPA